MEEAINSLGKREMQSEPGLGVTPRALAKDKLQVLLVEYSVY